jgi:hypothetical protein
VLDDVARLNEVLRLAPLVHLALAFCLAKPAPNGPIDPQQPDNPMLDVQAQCLNKIMGSMPSLRSSEFPLFWQTVDTLCSAVQVPVEQGPDDAAYVTVGLERFRHLMTRLTPPPSSRSLRARLSRRLRR